MSYILVDPNPVHIFAKKPLEITPNNAGASVRFGATYQATNSQDNLCVNLLPDVVLPKQFFLLPTKLCPTISVMT